MRPLPTGLLGRIRWANLARVLALPAVLGLVVAWPHLRGAPPRLPPSDPRPVVGRVTAAAQPGSARRRPAAGSPAAAERHPPAAATRTRPRRPPSRPAGPRRSGHPHRPAPPHRIGRRRGAPAPPLPRPPPVTRPAPPPASARPAHAPRPAPAPRPADALAAEFGLP